MSGKAKVVRGPKTSMEIPSELLKRAKHLAIEEGSNLRAIVAKALEEYVNKHEKGGRR
jgi:predicted transcriptional regulator